MTVVPLTRDDPATRPSTARDPAAGDSALVQRVHRRLVAEGGDEASLAGDALRGRLTELLRREEPLLAPATGRKQACKPGIPENHRFRSSGASLSIGMTTVCSPAAPAAT